MKRERQVFDPELQLLPPEDRPAAAELALSFREICTKAARARKVRNGLAAGALALITGLGVARFAAGVDYNRAESVLIGIGVGVGFGEAGRQHERARHYNQRAQPYANALAQLFSQAGIEPPAWTEQS